MFNSKSIDVFARTISSQPLGLAYHRPEKWAKAFHCFANVIKKAQQDGGCARFGWTFSCRVMSDAPDLGYLIATHHAVWHAPDGKLVDVTPFHTDVKHHPYAPTGDVLFLVDDKASPVAIGSNVLAPLPLKFFPLSNDERLITYVEQMRNKEEQQCRDIYQGKLEGIEKNLFDIENNRNRILLLSEDLRSLRSILSALFRCTLFLNGNLRFILGRVGVLLIWPERPIRPYARIKQWLPNRSCRISSR